MISVIIGKNLLNIKKKESAGLISGLKKLDEFGLEIISEGFTKKEFGNISFLCK